MFIKFGDILFIQNSVNILELARILDLEMLETASRKCLYPLHRGLLKIFQKFLKESAKPIS